MSTKVRIIWKSPDEGRIRIGKAAISDMLAWGRNWKYVSSAGRHEFNPPGKVPGLVLLAKQVAAKASMAGYVVPELWIFREPAHVRGSRSLYAMKLEELGYVRRRPKKKRLVARREPAVVEPVNARIQANIPQIQFAPIRFVRPPQDPARFPAPAAIEFDDPGGDWEEEDAA